MDINGKTEMACLIGSPVEHSLSPAIHNFAFNEQNVNMRYLCFDIKSKDLESCIKGIRAMGFKGFNITMPHKLAVKEHLDYISTEAELIGACNTVVSDNNKLTGYNTDGRGFFLNMEKLGFHAIGSDVTILGCGGSARSIIVTACLLKVKTINIFVRKGSTKIEKVRTLVEKLKNLYPTVINILGIENSLILNNTINNSDIVINCTPVGMGEDTNMPINDLSSIREGLYVADLIYNPLETLFLKECKARGAITTNGIGMLIYQGALAYKYWTGLDMPVDKVREHIVKLLKTDRRDIK